MVNIWLQNCAQPCHNKLLLHSDVTTVLYIQTLVQLGSSSHYFLLKLCCFSRIFIFIVFVAMTSFVLILTFVWNGS